MANSDNIDSVIEEIVALKPANWLQLARAAKFIHDEYTERSLGILRRLQEIEEGRLFPATDKNERTRLLQMSAELAEHIKPAKIIYLAALAVDDEEWRVSFTADETDHIRSSIEFIYPSGIFLKTFSDAARTLTASHVLYKVDDNRSRISASDELIKTSQAILRNNPQSPMFTDETILHIIDQDVGYLTPDVRLTLEAALETLHF